MKIIFSSDIEFRACENAERWCRDRGLSIGSPQRGEPRGLLFGSYLISKWRGMNDAEIDQLHGTMEGSVRHGPVTVTIKPAYEHLLVAATTEATP